MTKYKLRYKPKISYRASKEMILLMAKRGNHHHDRDGWRFDTDADVNRYFGAHGVDFQDIVVRCRDYGNRVPNVENLYGGTWHVSGGVKASYVDLKTDEELFSVQGPGQIVERMYWASFDRAVEARDRAVDNSSYPDMLVAAIEGVASIEGYVTYRAQMWNRRQPEHALVDSPQDKVTLDDKIDLWLPKLSGGKSIDKNSAEWSQFQRLRAIRDRVGIHPREFGGGISLGELATLANMFRKGVAGLLIQMHLFFGEKIPCSIIRARYAPDVEVVEEDEG